MIVFAVNNPRVHVPTVPDAKPTTVVADKDAATQPEAEGVKVMISADAFKAAAAKSPNSDIDESGLADNVQQILKMIRELKQQLEKKMAELQAVATDKRLTPEQVQARVASIQGEISTLQAGLMSAQASLLKAMKTLSADDALKAASLSM